MKRTYILLLLICSFLIQANAQLAMGKWRTHFAYNAVQKIAQTENKVFAISEGALFSVEKEDGLKEYYSKINGLNDGNVTSIDYDPFSKSLVIVYMNGNIDFLSTGGIINMSDLYNKQMSIAKTVNHIAFTPDRAYFSCNFGIMVVNTKKHEVADTYYIGTNGTEIKILSTAIVGGQIFALSENVLYKANANEPNLVNYEYWTVVPNLPGVGELKKVEAFAGKLVLNRGDKLFQLQNDASWAPIATSLSARSMFASNGKLIVPDGASSVFVIDEQLSITPFSNVGQVTDASYDATNNKYWLAANSLGLIAYTENGTDNPIIEKYKPNGPAVNIPYSMTFAGEKLFVVPGRLQFTEFLSGEVMILNKDNKNNNDEWMNIAASTIRDSTKYDVLNLMNIAVDSLDNSHFFVTSFGTGLYEFRNYKFIKWHTPLNSTLEPHYLVPNNPYRYTRLDGAVFDKNDNLFLTNSSVDKKIKILLKNGTWTSLKYEGLTNYDLGKILINNQNQNQKWVTAPHYGALGVFDDNGTLDIQTDDKFINFETFADADNEGSKISYKKGSCIAQDKNGIIWLGTDTGPLLFYNTSKVFDAGYTCSRVKIPRNNGTGLADYLLQSEHVKAIAIDGANRKWIGTETSGAYLLSENGQETIEHFTASNSPLLSNDVLSIEINPKTGEVFFGTGNGIVSYQSDAAESTGMYENVHAYPNPVRENFNGIITITGLVANTNVKITDLNGNLICQTVSNGAIATWNGKDTNGNKVRTGIYLAICANEDGTQSTITKIMVIN